MKKIAIIILALVLIPAIALATDDVSFAQDTNIDVNTITLVALAGGVVDQMVVGTETVTFSLSTNSSLTLISNDKKILANNLNLDTLCGSSYSQIKISGDSLGSSLVVTPSSGACTTSSGGGTSTSGGGIVVPSAPSKPTTTTGQVTATPSAGGKTTLATDENTTAEVDLPANAVTTSAEIKISKEAKNTVTASRPMPSGRSVVGSYVYNYTAVADGKAVGSFAKTITLTLAYADAQISGLDESTLKVYYWDESTSLWVGLSTALDIQKNTLTATTNHFTYFAILGRTAAEEARGEEGLKEEIVALNDGDIIRNPNVEGLAQFDVYVVKIVGDKKFKRLILSPHVFESYGHLRWENLKNVGQATMDEYITSDLVRAQGDPKVYKLTPDGDTGTKQWLNMSVAIFESAGYHWDSVYTINNIDRDAYTTGTEITH